MCRYNAALEQDVPVYNARLKEHLDAMLDRCSSTLAGGGELRPEVMWQLYNVAASARLLKAFVMLDEEKNADKVQGMIRDALSDYKAAIDAVDKTGAACHGIKIYPAGISSSSTASSTLKKSRRSKQISKKTRR